NQGISGGFGELRGEEVEIATHEALLALRAVGIGNAAAARNAELFLANNGTAIDSEVQLRRQLALFSTAFALQPSLLVTEGPGFDEQDALHLALALKVSHFSNPVPSPLMSDLAVQLSRLAASTGCYAFVENDASIELTSDVISALRDFTFNPLARGAYQSALSCLASAQRPDGSFGSPTATAAATLAFLQSGSASQNAITQARNYLIASQAADGSWQGSVRATALAVRALSAGAVDWRVATDPFGRPLLV